jgi:hypothetical protein
MTPESRNSPLLDNGSLKHIRDKECDMAFESRNSPLLDNGSLKHIRDKECDMAFESRKSPLLDNGSLKHISVTKSVTWRLKAGIVHC